MSSPTDRGYGLDDPSFYAPKWVREAARAERREHAPEFDANEELEVAQTTELPALAPPRPADDEPMMMMIEPLEAQRSLEPTILPDRWPMPRSRFGVAARCGLAALVATGVALVLVGKMPPVWNSDTSDRNADATSFGSRFAAVSSKGQEPMSPAAPQSPAAPVSPAVAPSPAMPVSPPTPQPRAVERPSAPAAQPAVTTPPPVRATNDDPPVVARATRRLDSGEIATLVKRGEELVASGDIVAARLVLRRAAEAGDARAALALAATYDPAMLEKLAVHGVAPDVEMARKWYESARAFGSDEAPSRLERLAASRAH